MKSHVGILNYKNFGTIVRLLVCHFLVVGYFLYSSNDLYALLRANKASYSKTYSITSSTVKAVEDWIDKDTVIIIGLDDVIMRPDYVMFSIDSPFRSFIDNLASKSTNNRRYAKLLSLWYATRKVVLMENSWVDFIEKAKMKGAKIYGFCRMPINLTNIEKYRYLELINLGIKFTETISDKNVFVFGRVDNWPSVFYQGVIYQGPFTFRKTIENFIRLFDEMPKKIMYFSTERGTMRKLEDAIENLDMGLKNIEYLAIEEYKPDTDFEFIKFQQNYFLKNGKMLGDHEVEQVMNKNKKQ